MDSSICLRTYKKISEKESINEKTTKGLCQRSRPLDPCFFKRTSKSNTECYMDRPQTNDHENKLALVPYIKPQQQQQQKQHHHQRHQHHHHQRQQQIQRIDTCHKYESFRSKRHSSSSCNRPSCFEASPKKISSKRKQKNNPNDCKMIIVLIILTFGIVASLFFTFLLDSCNEFPLLNQEYMISEMSCFIFGQELAIYSLFLALKSHVNKIDSGINKPLVLSFHGSSGVGKTLLASKVLNFFPATTNVQKFYPSIHLKDGPFVLRSYYCKWNVVIIDDAQDLTNEFVETFRETLANMKNSTKAQKIVVILVSNLYSQEINKIVFEKVKRQGLVSFHMSDFDPVFQNSPSGWLIDMKRKGLLDAFIPFLPLEKNSVLKCIEQELKQQNKVPIGEIVREISNDIVFYTLEGKDYQYSLSGCKKVADKVTQWTHSL